MFLLSIRLATLHCASFFEVSSFTLSCTPMFFRSTKCLSNESVVFLVNCRFSVAYVPHSPQEPPLAHLLAIRARYPHHDVMAVTLSACVAIEEVVSFKEIKGSLDGSECVQACFLSRSLSYPMI